MALKIPFSIKGHSDNEAFSIQKGDQSQTSNLQDSLGGLTHSFSRKCKISIKILSMLSKIVLPSFSKTLIYFLLCLPLATLCQCGEKLYFSFIYIYIHMQPLKYIQQHKKKKLKIPTNQGLYTQIHTTIYAHNCTQIYTIVYIHSYI